MNTADTFVFFGIVGSGKGTQIELLNKYLKEKNPDLKIINVYPGADFRKMAADGNYTGGLVKSTLDKGYLQPNFLSISLVGSVLINEMTEDSVLITDGFPRTVIQAENFANMMKFYGRHNIKIIYIELDKDEAVRRMKLRARSDDTEEGMANRFDQYVKDVLPSMDYFVDRPEYTIHQINGKQSVEDVHKEIISSLNI